MLNITNIQHLTTQARIYAAMKQAIKYSLLKPKAYGIVRNKHGKPIMFVEHNRSAVKSKLSFTCAKSNKDITATVLTSLRGV